MHIDDTLKASSKVHNTNIQESSFFKNINELAW